MKDYQGKNNAILEKFKERAEEHKDTAPFVKDGILYRGEFALIPNDEDPKRYWERQPGNENEIWEKSPLRILLITKDFNPGQDEPGATEDIRIETGRKNNVGTTDNPQTTTDEFFLGMMRHVYGFTRCLDGKFPPFDELDDDACRNVYENCALARINCKKQVGGGSLADSVLWKYVDDYSDLLKEQIDNFDADVIVCYGPVLFKALTKEGVLPVKFDPVENPCVYYDEVNNKIIVNSYHPSYVKFNGISAHDYYTNVIYEYAQINFKPTR